MYGKLRKLFHPSSQVGPSALGSLRPHPEFGAEGVQSTIRQTASRQPPQPIFQRASGRGFASGSGLVGQVAFDSANVLFLKFENIALTL